MQKQPIVFILLFFLLLFGMREGGLAVTFSDELGRKVMIAHPPQRIISIAPSVTEILFALDLGERIVGVSSYCNYPPEAKRKERVGGYINPSMEKIVALHPDLVIQTADGDLKTFVDRVASLGIPIYITNPRSVTEVMDSILRIGEVTFTSQGAQNLVGSMRQKIQDIQRRVQGQPQPRVLHAMSVDPLISSGKGTFVHDLILLSGGKNVAENARGKHPQLSMEEVMARDPEVILLSAMLSSDSLQEQKKWWQRWREISAVRSGRIYAVEADLILRPSPRIVRGLKEVARALHPELFKE
jgi:iron complex transport system substrate-binding protein